MTTRALTPLGALRALAARGITSVMVEGGATLLGSFLRARAFDQVVLFRAPLLLGGRDSLSAFGGPQPARAGGGHSTAPGQPARSPRIARRRRRAGAGRPRRRRGLVPCRPEANRLMFTGIVEEIGVVRASEARDDVVAVTIEARLVLDGLKAGDSVAVNGCCLTAVTLAPDGFECELTRETLARTSFGVKLAVGERVNLERPLAAAGRFDGHIVQGHVDGVGRVLALRRQERSAELEVAPPAALERYLVEKGSVGVDGVSLTVAGLRAGAFSVALIPFTLERTTLDELRPGDPVNLEADVIAKYVERLLKPRGSA